MRFVFREFKMRYFAFCDEFFTSFWTNCFMIWTKCYIYIHYYASFFKNNS